MTKIMRAKNLSDSFAANTGAAVLLAVIMMSGFQYAEAATINITSGENLTVGSTGAGVSALQGIMSELGYLEIPTGVAQGYYGQLTHSAVSRYQAARGVSPTAGYFGPMTKVSLHQDLGTRGMLTLLGW